MNRSHPLVIIFWVCSLGPLFLGAMPETSTASPCLLRLYPDQSALPWRRAFQTPAIWHIPNSVPPGNFASGTTATDVEDWVEAGFAQWGFCLNIPADGAVQVEVPIADFRVVYREQSQLPTVPLAVVDQSGQDEATYAKVTSAEMKIIQNPQIGAYTIRWSDCVTCNITGSIADISMKTIVAHEFGHVLGFAECNVSGYVMGPYAVGQDERAFNGCEIESGDAVYDCIYNSIPGSITASATPGSGFVRFEWTDTNPSGGDPVYTVLRATDCRGPYSVLGTVPKGQGFDYEYIDTQVTESRSYHYYVTDSNCASGGALPLDLPAPATAPAAPTNLTANWTGPGDISLSWTASTGAVSGYRIWRNVSVDNAILDCENLEPGTDCPRDFSVGSTVGTSIEDYIVGPLAASYQVSAYTISHGNENYSPPVAVSIACIPIVTVPDETLTMCPAGDADVLRIEVDLHDLCDEAWTNPNLPIEAVKLATSSSGIRLWANPETGYGETFALAGTYSLATGIATIEHARVSGCGTLYFKVLVNGQEVATNVPVNVRSVDQDVHVHGAVDRFDAAAFDAAWSYNVPCWDLNWSGGHIGADDFAVLGAHAVGRDHVVRKLTTPNGGEVIAPGDVVPISWQAASGDSARITLRIVHWSPADTSVIVTDALDTGNYNWTVPPTNKAGTNARVEVLHSAGYYKVDYADVGTDSSDEPVTCHATAVADLSAVTGRNTAVLTWSDPMQGTIAAEEHEIWYRHTTPMTNEDYTTGSTKLTYAPTPGISGTTHCVEINSLTQCKTYYFGMRTKDRGVWSKLSNVAVSQTDCSGFEVVFCEESGLMAGGGGGGEEGVQATRLASATSPLSAVGTDVTGGNSLLCGNRGVMAQDLFRLTTTGSALSDRVSEVVLRESALREASVDAVGLGVVAHPSGTDALPGGGAIWIGSRQRIDQARDAAGADVSAGLAAADEDGMAFRGGDFVTIELGGDARQTALVLESRNQVFAARDDSSGILVQRPDRSGAWSTVARVQPRRGFDRQAIPAEGAIRLRLVFLKEYSLRAIERLDGITAATPRTLALADAIHSRLGSVDGSVDRSGGEKTSLAMGDTLALRFTPLEPEAGMEHSYFFSIWGSIETAAEETRLQDAASLVVAADPVFANTLGAARPNPTTGGAVIAYTLAAPDQAELTIYNVSGRRIRTVLKAEQPPGAHEVQWDGKDTGARAVPAGVYFYRLRAGGWQSERKLIVLQR